MTHRFSRVAPASWLVLLLLLVLSLGCLASPALDANQWTHKTRSVWNKAVGLAQSKAHAVMMPAHLALALFSEPGGLASSVATKSQSDAKAIRAQLQKKVDSIPSQKPPPSEVRAGQLLLDVMQQALQLRDTSRDSHVAVDHVLLALTHDKTVGAILQSAGLTATKIANALTAVRGNKKVQSENAETTYEALEKYGVDLISLVRRSCSSIASAASHLPTRR